MGLIGPAEVELPAKIDAKKKFWGIWGRPQKAVGSELMTVR
jgi:hypothetical protein